MTHPGASEGFELHEDFDIDGRNPQTNDIVPARVSKLLDVGKRNPDLKALLASHLSFQSTATRTSRSFAEHETDLTSISSIPLENINVKRTDSVEAEYGSDSVHSETSGSSSSSGDSMPELPRPSTADNVGQMGSHLPEVSNGRTWPRLDIPASDDELQFIGHRIDRAKAAIRAVDNNKPRRSPSVESTDLPHVQRCQIFDPEGGLRWMTRKKNETPLTDANLLASDIEQQEYPRRRRNKKRGFVGVFIVVILMMTSFGLYYRTWLV